MDTICVLLYQQGLEFNRACKENDPVKQSNQPITSVGRNNGCF